MKDKIKILSLDSAINIAIYLLESHERGSNMDYLVAKTVDSMKNASVEIDKDVINELFPKQK